MGIADLCIPPAFGAPFVNADWSAAAIPDSTERLISLGFERTYRGAGWADAYLLYATYDAAPGTEYETFTTPAERDALWRGETQIDRQARNGRTTGLSGAFHLVSLIATNTATDGLTAGRFANDRHFNGQGGGQSLAEVAVFEDILTPAERDAVESYLTDKWFRGPDLRILEIAGTGSVGRADSGTLRVNVLTGTGQVLAEGAVEADTVKLAGALDLAGEGAYAVGLLRGAGTLTASAPILLEHVGLYREALTLAAPLIGASIDTVYGQGALTLDGGIGFSNVRVGDAIAVTNDGTALAVGWLSGQGTFNGSWQSQTLSPTNGNCATLIDLNGDGSGNVELRYYGQ